MVAGGTGLVGSGVVRALLGQKTKVSSFLQLLGKYMVKRYKYVTLHSYVESFQYETISFYLIFIVTVFL